MQKFNFRDVLWGFELSSSISVDENKVVVNGKYGGSVGIGYIKDINYLNATLFRKGHLFFITSSGSIGVKWSSLISNRMMNEQAMQIANYISQAKNNIRSNQRFANNNVNFSQTNYQQPSSSPEDEAKKLKELLDLGIITEEEFEKKKKDLLNL